MNHVDADREMSVEKYLLGELQDEARDRFEEHLFECQLCADDLKAAVLFAEAAREDLAAEVPVRVPVVEKKPSWFESLFRGQWMAPVLAACVLLLGYLSVFKVPALEQQIARADKPQILPSLALSSGATRGAEPTITAAANGAFLLPVDLPPLDPQRQGAYTGFVLSLYSPAGKQVWTQSVPASDANETVQILVPATSTEAGKNVLLVQGAHADGPMDELAKHEFVLELRK